MRVDSEIEQIRNGIIEALGRSVGMWGFNETYGRIFGLLYLADEALSLDDMAKNLMVSKATISINIRILEKLRAVQKVWQKGSRKDFYVAERDFEKIFQEMLRTTALDEMKIHKEASAQALAKYEAILKKDVSAEILAQAKSDLEKIHEYIRWIQIGERWLNFLMKVDVTEAHAGEMRRIEVEWEEDE